MEFLYRFGKCIIYRSWGKNCSLPIDVGIRDSGGTTRVRGMLGGVIEVYIMVLVKTWLQAFCMASRMSITTLVSRMARGRSAGFEAEECIKRLRVVFSHF